jgi:acetyltransferase-like isoleucine patch superfamily enzyme
MPPIFQLIKSALGPHWRARWYRTNAWFNRAKFKRQIGAGTYIDPSVHVLRWRSVRIGVKTSVAQHTTINVNDYACPTPTVVIGNHCWIGLRNFISPGQLIQLGDYCMTGPDCKFLGTGHVFADPFAPYISTGTAPGGQLTLGANCWIGANVVIMGHLSVGHGTVLGAGTLLLKSVPPFSVVVGNPGRVVKRYDIQSSQWIRADMFTPEMESMLPDEATYLNQLRTSHPSIPMPWRASGKHMGDTY